MKTKNQVPFENQLKRLEEIIESLDEGSRPIDELLKEFEEGMKLAKTMRDYLDKAELKIIEITKKNKIESDSELDDPTEDSD